eukprot:CAMPEP_0182462806 /NCGR_PEP_ID=MMETSP1319-20130603/6940_1 /TAXON_ID=172717 /ORGANISM="Bolidomonas pacifica, Strain RCC208" /LENGTH=49 /DNA_ID= /DNA_START= /DNA_END= /DNA_ORIENTATION=
MKVVYFSSMMGVGYYCYDMSSSNAAKKWEGKIREIEDARRRAVSSAPRP